MSFSPFAILTAEEMNDIVENIEALSDGSGLEDGAVAAAKLATGVPVQVVSTNYSAVATGTTLMSRADVKPTNTQGTEFMSQTITPKSASNILIIDAVLILNSSVSGASDLIAALFQDSTTDAIAATYVVQSGTTFSTLINLRHRMVAGTTSSTTFKIRGGGASAGTVTFNGIIGNRVFGGITISNITITEVKA